MEGLHHALRVVAVLACTALTSGCAVMRSQCLDPNMRPCTDGYALTSDGWRLGVRHYRPAHPDPSKYPVVLCHGLGLNGTFWTITDDHLPGQLTQHGYEVFVVDMRGSGASRAPGATGRANSLLRHTPFLEMGVWDWSADDESFKDVPAILDYVERETGSSQVNWIGHSLGGMLMFPYLELWPQPQRIATFVAMGSPAALVSAPETKMLRANRNLRGLLRLMSTSRAARPLTMGRPPGLDKVDRFYYSAENVDRRTIDRFYGFTLEDPGPGALRQLDHYLEFGRLVSADRKIDYSGLLDRVQVPILYVASDGDVLAPIDSIVWTYEKTGSPDKQLACFGTKHGHIAEYGHCDLVWSRNAPREIFPAVIGWLDQRQSRVAPTPQTPPALATPQRGEDRPAWALQPPDPSLLAVPQQVVKADLRPRLEMLPEPPDLVEIEE